MPLLKSLQNSVIKILNCRMSNHAIPLSAKLSLIGHTNQEVVNNEEMITLVVFSSMTIIVLVKCLCAL